MFWSEFGLSIITNDLLPDVSTFNHPLQFRVTQVPIGRQHSTKYYQKIKSLVFQLGGTENSGGGGR